MQGKTMQGKDIARKGQCKERTMQGKDNARKENARKGQCKERQCKESLSFPLVGDREP